jgi:hypothetical protein
MCHFLSKNVMVSLHRCSVVLHQKYVLRLEPVHKLAFLQRVRMSLAMTLGQTKDRLILQFIILIVNCLSLG